MPYNSRQENIKKLHRDRILSEVRYQEAVRAAEEWLETYDLPAAPTPEELRRQRELGLYPPHSSRWIANVRSPLVDELFGGPALPVPRRCDCGRRDCL
jgi:hypothetical protein